jgi:hypothetical protein
MKNSSINNACYGISVKVNNRFEPLDVQRGVTVTNIIHSSIFWDKEEALKVLEDLKLKCTKYQFKLVKRG